MWLPQILQQRPQLRCNCTTTKPNESTLGLGLRTEIFNTLGKAPWSADRKAGLYGHKSHVKGRECPDFIPGQVRMRWGLDFVVRYPSHPVRKRSQQKSSFEKVQQQLRE